jgi:hypothetical protein
MKTLTHTQVMNELSKRYNDVYSLTKIEVNHEQVTFQMANVVFNLYGEEVAVGVFTTDPYDSEEEQNKAKLHRVLVGSFGVYKF